MNNWVLSRLLVLGGIYAGIIVAFIFCSLVIVGYIDGFIDDIKWLYCLYRQNLNNPRFGVGF